MVGEENTPMTSVPAFVLFVHRDQGLKGRDHHRQWIRTLHAGAGGWEVMFVELWW